MSSSTRAPEPLNDIAVAGAPFLVWRQRVHGSMRMENTGNNVEAPTMIWTKRHINLLKGGKKNG